jgi:RimJ/RimL family protein N-acetyltransferase
MNADPRVMEHFVEMLSRAESDALIARNEESFERHGYGLWAVEQRADGDFVGMVGILPLELDLPFAPGVEVGWRLAHRFWGQGLASEAATASLAFGFEQLRAGEIVAFTSLLNTRSIAVMERIGMHRDPQGDFLHPLIDPRHALAPHVLYRVEAPLRRSASGAG